MPGAAGGRCRGQLRRPGHVGPGAVLSHLLRGADLLRLDPGHGLRSHGQEHDALLQRGHVHQGQGDVCLVRPLQQHHHAGGGTKQPGTGTKQGTGRKERDRERERTISLERPWVSPSNLAKPSSLPPSFFPPSFFPPFFLTAPRFNVFCSARVSAVFPAAGLGVQRPGGLLRGRGLVPLRAAERLRGAERHLDGLDLRAGGGPLEANWVCVPGNCRFHVSIYQGSILGTYFSPTPNWLPLGLLLKRNWRGVFFPWVGTSRAFLYLPPSLSVLDAPHLSLKRPEQHKLLHTAEMNGTCKDHELQGYRAEERSLGPNVDVSPVLRWPGLDELAVSPV